MSLITTVYNEENSILDFLVSYLRQKKYADEFIIVDGGSTDNTIEVINNFQEKYSLKIKLIIDHSCSKKYTKSPIAKGRNKAIKNARNEIIITADAGCILKNNFISDLSLPILKNECDLVGGLYYFYKRSDFSEIYYKIAMTKIETLRQGNIYPSSRAFAFKKHCWFTVNGYPEYSHTAEDTLFVKMLLSKKYTLCYTNKVVVLWKVPNNLRDAMYKQFYYGKGNAETKILLKSFLQKIIILLFPIILFFKRNHRKYFIYSYLINVSHLFGYLYGYGKMNVKRIKQAL